MKLPLEFLSSLKKEPSPPIVHFSGDDVWIRETLRNRIIEVWTGKEADSAVERLVGTGAIPELFSAGGPGSLFTSRKVIILSDPSQGERGTSLSSAGKNQIAELASTLAEIPKVANRVIIETGTLKATSGLNKTLAKIAVQVDTSPPKEAGRQKWIPLLAKRAAVRLAPDLSRAMSVSTAPLGTLVEDLEKLALATEEGEEASLATWTALSQADPESTVWEIGDNLGLGRADNALESLKNLEDAGQDTYSILPSMLSWNQQRLQVKSYDESRGQGNPEGVHPYVLRKVRGQVSNRLLKRLRDEQRALHELDWLLKRGLEDPHVTLEKLFVQFAQGERR